MNLETLEEIQRECAKKIIDRDDFEKIETVGGVDLTFEDIKANPTRGWACLVVVDLKTYKVLYTHVVEGTVDFPYIPTFLAFRELPLMLKLYQEAKVKPDVFFIDGQGMAHTRFCGIASHFGVETGCVSVGVAKKPLVGRHGPLGKEKGSVAPIIYRGKTVGMAVRTKESSSPIYVSVGHRISLVTSVKLVLKLSKYRIPEPTRLAHNFLQKIRKSGL